VRFDNKLLIILGELEHALNISKPKFVFVSPSFAEKTTKVCRRLKYVKNVIVIEGKSSGNFVLSLPELIKKHGYSEFDVQKSVHRKVDVYNQVALIMCSSGTTGLPKGVLTTQANMMSCLRTYRNALKFFRAFHNFDVIAFNIGPWFHVLGFLSMYIYASNHSCQYVYLTKFEEKTFFEALEVNQLLK
jgi:4-coumarate--CoA ligase